MRPKPCTHGTIKAFIIMTNNMNRRFFLYGTSAAAVSAALPNIAIAAPISLKAAAAAPLSGPAAPTSGLFNRGRSQVNLNFLQIGGDFPFLNCLKTAQEWGLVDNSDYPDPLTLDSDGYPLSISHGGVKTIFFVPSQIERPGNYVITWSGNGTIYCGMNHTLVGGSKTSTSGSGRYVFSTPDTRFVVGISSIGNPRITDMKVFHVNDEAALNAGEVFGARFKQRLIEANFGVIRFLNWQCGNTTNVTTWASRKPVSYVYYSGSEFRSSLYAGFTTNNGSAFSATLNGFRLVDKATVIVKFNADCNGACTLNVNGTGAINILSEYSSPLSAGGNSFPMSKPIWNMATLVYDVTLNAWIKQGGDAAMLSQGLISGCPPELMVRLCAEVGAHPYFVTPQFSIDPATDYMSSLASYCRANGPSWMVPRFEGPNELWNNAGGFYQTGYALAKANAYGWGNDYHNWYGKALSVLGQAISAVYGNDRTKYHVLCGVQTGTAVNALGADASEARLSSAKYLSQAAPAQSPYAKSAASNWVTHVCCAQYIIPSEYGTPREAADATVFASASAALKQAIATSYANTVNSGSGSFTISKCAVLYANWKTWAQKFGVKKMCGYEGGYSPDYSSFDGSSQLDMLRAASKLSPSLSGFTTTNYNNFVSLTDGNFTSEFPSCFQLSGLAPSGNAWAVLENIYQTPNPPQWNAIVSFNSVR